MPRSWVSNTGEREGERANRGERERESESERERERKKQKERAREERQRQRDRDGCARGDGCLCERGKQSHMTPCHAHTKLCHRK